MLGFSNHVKTSTHRSFFVLINTIKTIWLVRHEITPKAVFRYFQALRYASLLEQSPLFELEWYFEQHPDLTKLSTRKALIHHIRFGDAEFRQPNRFFDSRWYAETYDIGWTSPTVHFLKHQQHGKVSPGPRFSCERYLQHYHDVVLSQYGALEHYLLWGEAEGRKYFFVEDALAHYVNADQYRLWRRYNVASIHGLTLQRKAQTHHLTISLLVPLYRPDITLLGSMIDSVFQQSYSHWELCLCDDGSNEPALTEYLLQLKERDARVKVVTCSENGHISRATNFARTLASGEFLAFVDQDDVLALDCLFELASAIVTGSDTALVYSDDDKISEKGNHLAPQFKPDYSPELLLSYMYIGHIMCVRTALFDRLGGFRTGYEGAQDFDFALRLSDIIEPHQVVHIPKILYSWRVTTGSTAKGASSKSYSLEAGKRAVDQALKRRGVAAEVYVPEWAKLADCGYFNAHFYEDAEAASQPSVAVVVPTKNGANNISRLMRSLVEKTTYKNYHIYIIDNDSDDVQTLRLLREYNQSQNVTVRRISNKKSSFNFSYINNTAVSELIEDFVLFLNDDTEVIQPRWLNVMVGYATMSGVGIVGARLLYPDYTVQHGGVLLNVHGSLPGHAFKHLPGYNKGYLGLCGVACNRSAVTAACMLTPRALFNQLQGFDEERFAVAYNDVDYCLRAIDTGMRVVYAGNAELIHYETQSRAKIDNPAEEHAFMRQYTGRYDPFYNINLCEYPTSHSIRTCLVGQSHILPKRMERPFVLFISHNLALEGAPLVFFELVKGLRNALDILVISPEDGPLKEEYQHHNISVRVVPEDMLALFPVRFEEFIAKLAALITPFNKPDCVISNTILTHWGYALAEHLNIPHILIVHESEPPFSHIHCQGADMTDRAKNAVQCSYRTVFVCEATRDVYQGFDVNSSFEVIYNGIDIKGTKSRGVTHDKEAARLFLGVGHDEFVFLLPGTLCARKNQLLLLKALQSIEGHAALKKTTFYVVGEHENPYGNKFRELILHAGLENRVKLIPPTRHIFDYYRASDAFICTSALEAYPKVIQEALMAELPIITTNVFGIRDQVRHGYSALMVESNDEEKLAECIVRVVSEPKLRETLVAGGRYELAMMQTLPEMCSRYKDLIYHAIVANEYATCDELS